MTTDASVYKIVDDLRVAHNDARTDLLEMFSVADALYGSLVQAINTGAIPEHAVECECNMCTAINEYKVIRWKMMQ